MKNPLFSPPYQVRGRLFTKGRRQYPEEAFKRSEWIPDQVGNDAEAEGLPRPDYIGARNDRNTIEIFYIHDILVA